MIAPPIIWQSILCLMGMGVSLAVVILIAIRSGRLRKQLDWPTFILYIAPLVVVGNSAIYVASAAIEWQGFEGMLQRSMNRHSEDRFQFESANGVYEIEFSGGGNGELIRKAFEAPIGPSIVFGIIVSTVVTTLGLAARRLTVSLVEIQRKPGHCISCGYDLTGNESGICPECGFAVGASPLDNQKNNA